VKVFGLPYREPFGKLLVPCSTFPPFSVFLRDSDTTQPSTYYFAFGAVVDPFFPGPAGGFVEGPGAILSLPERVGLPPFGSTSCFPDSIASFPLPGFFPRHRSWQPPLVPRFRFPLPPCVSGVAEMFSSRGLRVFHVLFSVVLFVPRKTGASSMGTLLWWPSELAAPRCSERFPEVPQKSKQSLRPRIAGLVRQ